MKYALFLSGLMIILSCNENPDATATTDPVNVDSLTAAFSSGWNNKDSAAIMKTIAEDAVVMIDTSIYKGHAAIAKDWVSGGVKFLSNIKVSSLVKNSNENIAFDGGTYTLNITPPGGPVLKEKGNYSFAWTKMASGEWKLNLIHIENVSIAPETP